MEQKRISVKLFVIWKQIPSQERLLKFVFRRLKIRLYIWTIYKIYLFDMCLILIQPYLKLTEQLIIHKNYEHVVDNKFGDLRL